MKLDHDNDIDADVNEAYDNDDYDIDDDVDERNGPKMTILVVILTTDI